MPFQIIRNDITKVKADAANMDVIFAARSFGIREDRAVRYACDSAGTSLNFEVASKTIARVRNGQEIEADWCAEIEEDYGKRG